MSRSSRRTASKTARFRIGINADGTGIGEEGELPLTLCVADDADELAKIERSVPKASSTHTRAIFTGCFA